MHATDGAVCLSEDKLYAVSGCVSMRLANAAFQHLKKKYSEYILSKLQ